MFREQKRGTKKGTESKKRGAKKTYRYKIKTKTRERGGLLRGLSRELSLVVVVEGGKDKVREGSRASSSFRWRVR